MTVCKAHDPRATRRTVPGRAAAVGLAVGLLSAFTGVHAAQAPAHASLPLMLVQAAAVDPAKQAPATVSVDNIDFRRGDGGAGKLVLRFDGEGAMPDLRTQGSEVVVRIGNASVPTELQRPLDVVDFATPVRRIDTRQGSDGVQVAMSVQGGFESMAYQSGRDYIVEIVPRAASAQRAVGAAPAPGARASGQEAASRAYAGRAVTFNFQDVPVRTVLQLIAEESDLNIVASDSVVGNVTLRLVNVPWDQALDLVLQAKSLDKRRNGNVVWVAPQAEIAKYEQDREDARLAIEDRAEMVTEYIPISYGNAEDIAKLLTEESKNGSGGGGSTGGGGAQSQNRGFLSARGSLSFDRRTNTLLVIDIPQRVTEVKRLVSQLDKPVDQVVIEARIVIANESFARELGAQFGISGTRDNVNFSGNLDANTDNWKSIVDTSNTNNQLLNQYRTAYSQYESQLDVWRNANDPSQPRPVAPSLPNFVTNTITRGLNTALPASLQNAGSLALSILNAGYLLDIELSALQVEGRGEVISNPRIITSNQKEAVIRQGQEVGYLTVTGGQSNSIPTVEFKDVLLELKVTPTITHDGRVYLNMALKKDEVQGFINVGAGLGEVPQINKREINTAVLIEDGQTVSIGGVYEFRERSDMSKVPFLGDLPFLGNLFKKRGRNKEKAELLIFVTPKVLRVAQRE